MYNIHVVKRFRAHCGFYAIENKLLLLFAWYCVQVRYRHIRQAAIPARVVLGTAVFCDQSNQYLVYEFPFCAMHMRVSSVSLPYLQNRLPSLIISAILAQYSSLCDHLVLQFNLG